MLNAGFVNTNGGPQKTIRYTRVVHLSHVIHPDIPHWPGDPPTKLDPVARWEEDGFALHRLSIGEHTGTHLNTPHHFSPAGAQCHQYPAEQLIAPAVVFDCRDQVQKNPDFTLAPEDVQAWEHTHGPVPEGSFVLMCTGWDDRWGDEQAFLNADEDGTLHFPGFGVEAAAWLIEERRIAGLGIDTHGIDPGRDTHFATNQLALQHGKLVLENLANLSLLPPTGSTVVIGILRLLGGTGSPAGVLALVP